MDNTAEQFADRAIIRQIDLQRVATWILRTVSQDLAQLEKDIVAQIFDIDPTGVNRIHAQRARMQLLLVAVQNQIRKVLREIEDRIETSFDDVIQETAQKERNDLLAFFTIRAIAFSEGLPKGAELLIQGSTLSQWRKRISEETIFRVRNQIQDQVSHGNSASKIADAIRGETALRRGNGEMVQTEKALDVVVRTGVDSIANETALAVGQEIPEETESQFGDHGWQQLSVLDNRTTEICKSYAFKIWDASYEPVGHKLPFNGGPPRHIYCRSRVVLIFLDDPIKPQSFKEWLGKKSPAEQRKIFGESKIDLWNKGKISDMELIRQIDRQMTLDQYREKS